MCTSILNVVSSHISFKIRHGIFVYVYVRVRVCVNSFWFICSSCPGFSGEKDSEILCSSAVNAEMSVYRYGAFIAKLCGAQINGRKDQNNK